MDQQSIVLFYAFFVTNILGNFDHGVIPGCTMELKRELGINDTYLGLLGSLVYFGIMVGSLIGGFLFEKIQPKNLILTHILLYIGAVLPFPLFSHIEAVVIVSRFTAGVAQSLFFIYFPVWIDLHGESNKTLWLSYVQLTSVTGFILGYVFTAISTSLSKTITFIDWRFSYYFLAFCLVVTFEIIRRFKSDLFIINKLKDQQQNIESNQVQQKQDIKASVVKILRNPGYVFSMLTVSALFFVLTAIQYWFAEYMITVHRMDPEEAKLTFIFVSVTAPTLGLFIGGRVCHSIGGYEGPNSSKYCLILTTITCCISLPIPYLRSSNVVVICNWMWLFLGGALLPTIAGIMISRLKPQHKNIGSSIAQFCQNLLGYIPAPILYGLANEMDPKHTGSLGMRLLVIYQLQAVLLMIAFIVYEGVHDKNHIINVVKELKDINKCIVVNEKE